MLKNLLKRFSIDKAGLFLIVTGSTVWSLTMVKSGLVYSYGMGFWGPNGHDGVWHISLSQSLSRGLFNLPIFAGELVKNYHIGFDVFLGAIYRLTGIPLTTIYFQIFPIVAAILIGYLTYTFIYRWKKDREAAFWSTFFVYFAGNYGWIVPLVRSSQLGGESTFWAQPSVLSLINPPFALSLIFILVGLLLVENVKINKAPKLILAASVFFGLLIQIKAYAGVIVVGALAVTSVYNLIANKSFRWFGVFVVSALVSVVVFLPFYSSGSLLEFSPFWFLETMMAFPDRVGWLKFSSAMVNYKLEGNPKAVLAYGFAFAIFWYGNVGMRLASELYWVKLLHNKAKPHALDVFLASATFLGVVLTMVFVQKGTPWNTIQFFYYSLFFMSLVSGVVFAGILRQVHKSSRYILIIGTVILSGITAASVLLHYLPQRPPAMVGLGELEALGILRTEPDGVVLVMPFDRTEADKAISSPPRPLYLYESTAYVSALSAKSVWLEDEVNLSITDYPWQERRARLVSALSSPESFRAFLAENNISYVYAVGYQIQRYQDALSAVNRIYDSSGAAIYEFP